MTVTNSTEKIAVQSVASNLGLDGSIAFDGDSNRVLVVSGHGQMSLVNPANGAVTSLGFLDRAAAGATVLDIAVDSLSSRGGHFFALVWDAPNILLLYVDTADSSSRVLWFRQAGSLATASLGMRGNEPLVALGDSGDPPAAQAPAILSGNILLMTGGGDLSNPLLTVTPRWSAGACIRRAC